MKILLNFAFFFLSLSIAAQEEHSPILKDFESWNKISIQTKLAKGLNAKLSQSLRLKENASTLKVLFTEAALIYKLNKRISVGIGYRSIFPKDDLNNHRFHLLGRYKISPKRWNIAYRLKLDNETEDFRLYTHNVRNRLKIGYNIRKWKWDPEIGVEVFYNYQYNNQGFNKIRLMIGTEYKINKKLDFSIGGVLQRTFNQAKPKQTGIFSLGLGYEF